jgi:hypothetical protein
MTEEVSGQWELCTGSEGPEAYDMAYIRNKYPAKVNRCGVPERSDRATGHTYQ